MWLSRSAWLLLPLCLGCVSLGSPINPGLTWPPQDAFVHPCLYKDARPDEQFFISAQEPVVIEQTLETYEDGTFYRKTVWGPYYFVSRVWALIGPYTPGDKGPKVWGLQWYRGEAKVDATRTIMLNLGLLCKDPIPGWVYTTTPREMKAFRYKEVDFANPGSMDQAGY